MSAGLRKNLASGTQLWIALAGATLTIPGSAILNAGDFNSYTAVGRAAKPSATDGTWVKIEPIESIEFMIDNGQGLEVWEPSPGGIELADVLRVGRKTVIKFTVGSVQPLTYQLLDRATQLNSGSTLYTPAAVPNEVYCWIKIQTYDHAGNLFRTRDAFCELVLSAAIKHDPKALTKPEYTAQVLSSGLNSVAFA